MAGMTAYILGSSGELVMARSGDVDSVMLAIEIEKTPYTLQPPPDNESRWRWVNNEWIADDTAD